MPDEEQVWLGKELERLIKKPDTIVNVTLEGGGHLYPVSNAFLNAVKANTRKYYWTGKITTTAGTVYLQGAGTPATSK